MNLSETIEEISTYEISEEKFRRSCCTAYDLCKHPVTITIPQKLWLHLKDLLQQETNQDKSR